MYIICFSDYVWIYGIWLFRVEIGFLGLYMHVYIYIFSRPKWEFERDFSCHSFSELCVKVKEISLLKCFSETCTEIWKWQILRLLKEGYSLLVSYICINCLNEINVSLHFLGIFNKLLYALSIVVWFSSFTEIFGPVLWYFDFLKLASWSVPRG